MQRNIYLEGEIGERFGSVASFNAPTVKDAMCLIDVNNEGFRNYLMECHEKGVGFHIDVAGSEIEYGEELLMPLSEGDITITPVPAGAKAIGKILAAILIVVLVIHMPFLSGGIAQGLAGVTGWGWAALAVASSLAMAGLSEMMAPDPSVDTDQESSYLFNGKEQNVIEGDPVPVLYGRLKVPGQPINFEVTNLNSPHTANAQSFGF